MYVGEKLVVLRVGGPHVPPTAKALVTFHDHKAMLVRVPAYFRAAFADPGPAPVIRLSKLSGEGFKKAQTGEIDLPSERSENVELFLQRLYTSWCSGIFALQAHDMPADGVSQL